MYPTGKLSIFVMERNIYIDPIHNTACERHFSCGAVNCPKEEIQEQPSCYTEKFSRYQPDSDRSDICDTRGMEKADRIGLDSTWLAILAIIAIFSLFWYTLRILYASYPR